MKPVFASRQFATALLAVGILASLSELKGADLPLPVSGELLGTVVDSGGIPQMGAAVSLFNKYQRIVARTVTNMDGRFAFSNLGDDTYSVRVSQASFLPASSGSIKVKPGFASVLDIRLATLLSNIQLRYRIPDSAMSEEWKWVLRSSPATRPINRYVPVELPQEKTKVHPHVFSGTRAMVSLSGRDGGLIDSDELGADMGTSFAVSTNILGSNQVQVAGTIGQNSVFGPAAMALCAIYSRTDGSPFGAPPEVTLTMAQVGGIGSQLSGVPNSGTNANTMAPPVLRTMSLGMYQVADPVSNVHIEYGATEESVEYGQHVSRLNPFGRISVDLGSGMAVIGSYSEGGRPNELIAHQQYQEAMIDGQNDDLTQPLDSISRLPQISNRDGHIELERTANYEVGVTKKVGSRTFSASEFFEDVANGRLNVAGNLSVLNPGNLFSDGISATSIYNIGSYERFGYLISMDQHVASRVDFGVAYGRLGGFAANSGGLDADNWASARFLTSKQSNFASFNINATVPRLGTRISANYGWIDPRTVVPVHIYTTQNTAALPGFNVLVRQPLPSMGIPGRFELTADLRNLGADGYTPINTGDGRRLLVVETPRAIRGGLKFTF